MEELFIKSLKVGDSIQLVIKPGIEVTGNIKKLTNSYVIVSSLLQENNIKLESILSWRKLNFNKVDQKDEERPSGKEPKSRIKLVNNESDIEVETVVPPKIKESIDLDSKIHLDENIAVNKAKIISPSEKDYESVPWTEIGIPQESLFKGRVEIIDRLKKHYTSSISRKQTYILYGLTRTGKSTIIEYLSKDIEGQQIRIDGIPFKISPFIWNFGQAASHSKAEGMWTYLVEDCIIKKLYSLNAKKTIALDKTLDVIQKATTSGKYRFATFKRVISELKLDNIYPIIFIDEFTFFRTLHKGAQLDASFLSVIRELSMKGLVSFLFAGTYDIKDMISDPEIGITGQFANTIDYEVSQISVESAKDLINVWDGKLKFSEDALNYILQLSNRIPYFIQILCKNLGFYSLENGIENIEFDDVEIVVRLLIGQDEPPITSMINTLAEGVFLNNQHDPTESNEINALISTLSFLNKNNSKPEGMKITDIFELWDINKLTGINVLISQGLQRLKTKGIVKVGRENEYFIAVDLFRRWWFRRHNDIKLELNFLEGYTS
ncbi:MAG: ATP-binding protein [Bacteroidales bacterium]|nr:ATP-binding protein [Bacteroidales bacterium]